MRTTRRPRIPFDPSRPTKVSTERVAGGWLRSSFSLSFSSRLAWLAHNTQSKRWGLLRIVVYLFFRACVYDSSIARSCLSVAAKVWWSEARLRGDRWLRKPEKRGGGATTAATLWTLSSRSSRTWGPCPMRTLPFRTGPPLVAARRPREESARKQKQVAPAKTRAVHGTRRRLRSRTSCAAPRRRLAPFPDESNADDAGLPKTSSVVRSQSLPGLTFPRTDVGIAIGTAL